MLRREKFGVQRRLLVLGLLTTCLFVYGSESYMEPTNAGRCMQECDVEELMCYDACPDECSADDPTCNNCILTCRDQNMDCMRFAMWCGNGGVSYSSVCQVGYADHCPVDPNTGVANCNDPSAHSGYFQICQNIGGGQCVACPDHESCYGSGGMPPC